MSIGQVLAVKDRTSVGGASLTKVRGFRELAKHGNDKMQCHFTCGLHLAETRRTLLDESHHRFRVVRRLVRERLISGGQFQ